MTSPRASTRTPLLVEPRESKRSARGSADASPPVETSAVNDSTNDNESQKNSSQNLRPVTSRATRVVTSLFEQVNSVRDVATRNVEMLFKRDEDLVELNSKVEEIESASGNFKTTAEKMGDRYEKKNRKMMAILVPVVSIVIILIIICVILVSLK